MSCFKPTTQQELSEWIVERGESQQKVHWLGVFGRQDELSLELAPFKQVIDYPFRDMTITVETGMTLSRLQQVLAEHQQWLPLNVPSPETTTLAEVICRNWFGSFSAGYGTMRDWLLGVTAIDGRGRIFHAGGRVVKNVAGYDLCKLLVGSNGKLAIPVTATLQVKPQPKQILVHRLSAKQAEGLNSLWKTIRDLPFNPVVFDVVTSDDNDGNKHFLYAVEGSEETTRSLSDQIEQAVRRQSDAELLAVEPWSAEMDPWLDIANHSSQSVILRLGSVPSQTIDLLEIATRQHWTGFGLTSRGVSIVKSPRATQELPESELLQSLVAEVSTLNVNIQALSDHQVETDSAQAGKNEAAKNSLMEKIKLEFDPHQLFS